MMADEMSSTEFDVVKKHSREALDRILNGDSGGYKQLYSRTADITLGNPFGGFGHGWDQVVEQLDRAASYYRDGRAIDIDTIVRHVTPELAYTVEIEHAEAKVGGSPDLSQFAVRVSCVYRHEADGWKLVHRHADPRVARQTAESVLQT
jgi:ketosteroid isomerase-like protein